MLHVIFLREVEQLPNFGCSLRAEAARNGLIGESLDLGLTLPANDQGQHGEVGVNDASANGLPLAFTGTTGAIATVAFRQKQADATVGENALFHGETLLVVPTGDTEDVTESSNTTTSIPPSLLLLSTYNER